jgi:hypothetical protein
MLVLSIISYVFNIPPFSLFLLTLYSFLSRRYGLDYFIHCVFWKMSCSLSKSNKKLHVKITNRSRINNRSYQIDGHAYAQRCTCPVGTSSLVRTSITHVFLCSCKVFLCNNEPISTHILFLLFSSRWRS